MKLHAIQFAQFEVTKTSEGIRVSRVPGVVHQIMAIVTFTEGQRAGLAAVVGL